MSTYDDKFFDYVNSGAIASARNILPLLLDIFEVDSVLDVGCGQGAWLSIWKELGVSNIQGIDGDYVNRERLLIEEGQFKAIDLAAGFDLERRFSIVQTLEVAEHLPESSAPNFVASLIKHGNIILFSAAPRGQGGDQHINEQPYDYWRRLFATHGYTALDYIRPEVKADRQIEEWYRFNSFLYIREDLVASLCDKLKSAVVSENEKLTDVSPTLYKLRKLIVRLIPVAMMTPVAKVKERVIATLRGATS